MVAMISFRLLRAPLDCGLDDGPDDDRRSTRTLRPKQRGGRRKAGYFDWREEAEAQRGGENSQAAPLRGYDRGLGPNLSAIPSII
jgi:hypothetical protein